MKALGLICLLAFLAAGGVASAQPLPVAPDEADTAEPEDPDPVAFYPDATEFRYPVGEMTVRILRFGAAGRRAIVYLHGDIDHRADPDKAREGLSNAVRFIRLVHQRTGVTTYLLLRPGLFEPGADYHRRQSGPYLHGLSLALARLMAEQRLFHTALIGHSGGAASVLAALTLVPRLPVPCVVLASGLYQIELGRDYRGYMASGGQPWRYRPSYGVGFLTPDKEATEHYYDVRAHLGALDLDPRTRLLLVADRRDRIAPYVATAYLYEDLLRHGLSADLQPTTRTTDEDFHGTVAEAFRQGLECLRQERDLNSGLPKGPRRRGSAIAPPTPSAAP